MTNNLVITPNHHSGSVHEDIENICKNFFCRTEVANFLQIRMFDNGYCVPLTNVPYLIEHHFNSFSSITPPIPSSLITNQFYFMADQNSPEMRQEIATDYLVNVFKIYNPLFIFRRHYKYFDMFIFSLKQRKNDVFNYYMNNLNIFNTFIDNFLNDSFEIYNTLLDHKILVPDPMRPTFKGINHKVDINEDKLSSISTRTKIESLTERESNVLYFLSIGMTAKETSAQLEISPKTVEWHLANIKNKLGVYRRSSIISLINKISQ